MINIWTLQENFKKTWNLKVTVIPIVTGALEMIPEGLINGMEELKIGGWAETIQTCSHSDSSKISTNADVKNSQMWNMRNLSWKIRHTKFIGILRYRRITKFRPDDET